MGVNDSNLKKSNLFKHISCLVPIENKYTRLEPKNKIHSVEEGIKARIKDPCWILGRQWQMGEFKAENGGSPVRTEISYIKQPLNTLQRGNSEKNFDLKNPVEMLVEEEKGGQSDDDQKLEGWDPKHLEYSFSIKGKDIQLSSKEYDGNKLEWYNFGLKSQQDITGEEIDINVPPRRLSYKGMPHPRWWTFEDHNVDLGNIKRPYLNYLTMLLMEFALFYSNDWFSIPIPHEIGYIRKITRFKVIDSFGITTDLTPVVDPSQENKGWEIFTISNQNGARNDGSLFYLPNTLMDGSLESEPIEEVSLMRDEIANLVWAIEHKYENSEGKIINRHDEEVAQKQRELQELKEEAPIFYWNTEAKKEADKLVNREDITDPQEIGTKYIGPLAKYELMSYIPPYWIPYVAKQISSLSGQIILRRGRTSLDEAKQCKGVFLNESHYIYEEEVPKSGVLLKRVWQLARDIEGNYYSWLGRKKSQDMKRKSVNLRFDYLKNRK